MDAKTLNILHAAYVSEMKCDADELALYNALLEYARKLGRVHFENWYEMDEFRDVCHDAGTDVLIEISQYNPAKSAFSTFAFNRIKHDLMNWIEKQHLPVADFSHTPILSDSNSADSIVGCFGCEWLPSAVNTPEERVFEFNNHTPRQEKVVSIESFKPGDPKNPFYIQDDSLPVDTKLYYAQLLGRLSREDRELFALVSEGCSQAEIAEKKGVSQQAISLRWKQLEDLLRSWHTQKARPAELERS